MFILYKSSKGDFIFCLLFSVTCLLISVVFELLLPNNSCIYLNSVLDSKRCVAYECLYQCNVTGFDTIALQLKVWTLQNVPVAWQISKNSVTKTTASNTSYLRWRQWNRPIISVETTPFMFPKRKNLKKPKENQKKLPKRQRNPKGNWNMPVK